MTASFIDLRLLRQFTVVAGELHFRRAAERLNMSQPPLSQAIKRLEEGLGVQLLIRTRQQVRLTAVGEMFLRDALETLAVAEKAVESARLAGRGFVGRLRIGFVGSATFRFLPLVIRLFRERFAGVELHLEEMTTVEQLNRLAAGRIEIGLLRPPMPRTPHVMARELFSERFLAVLPAGHPLEHRRSINLAELASDPLITFPPNDVPGIFAYLMNAFREQGVTPRLGQSAIQIHTMMSLVSGGLGVSLVPESAETARHAGTVLLPVADQVPRLRVGQAVAWQTTFATPLLRHFLDTCDRATEIILQG